MLRTLAHSGERADGAAGVSGGFSVNHAELADRAAEVSSLAGRAASLASRVKQALTGMAEAVGYPSLAGALMETNLLSGRRLAELGVLYEHVGESLKTAAKRYDSTDAQAARRIGASRGAPW
jgi:hypothetical protein